MARIAGVLPTFFLIYVQHIAQHGSGNSLMDEGAQLFFAGRFTR